MSVATLAKARTNNRPRHIVHPRIRDAAIERYIADQERQVRQESVIAKRRRAMFSVALLKAINHQAGKMHNDVVGGRPFVAVFVEVVCYYTAFYTRLGIALLSAHCLGWIGRSHYYRRLAICNDCTYHQPDSWGQRRCRAPRTPRDKECNCTDYPWWPFNRDGWRLRLRNWKCLIGKFGRRMPRGVCHGDTALAR